MINDSPSPKSLEITQRWITLAGLIETVAQAMYERTNDWAKLDLQAVMLMTWDDLDSASQDRWRQLACDAIDAIARYRA